MGIDTVRTPLDQTLAQLDRSGQAELLSNKEAE
jgi:hypothetical protein